MKLKNKIGIITGSSRGIGKALAVEAAREGARVVINYKKNRWSAKKTLSEILKAGSEGILVRADVSDLKDVRMLIKKTITKYNRLDFLINNAGFTSDALIENMSYKDWDTVIKTHLYGPFYLMKYCLPYLSKTKGAIINVTSRAAFRGFLVKQIMQRPKQDSLL